MLRFDALSSAADALSFINLGIHRTYVPYPNALPLSTTAFYALIKASKRSTESTPFSKTCGCLAFVCVGAPRAGRSR